MYQQCIQQEDNTHDIANKDEDFNTTIEKRILKDIITNHCLSHKIENDFVCTPRGYKATRSSQIQDT